MLPTTITGTPSSSLFDKPWTYSHRRTHTIAPNNRLSGHNNTETQFSEYP